MAMMAAQQENPAVADGDSAFWRVNTRTPAHELPAGVCADATNKRFEDGRAWPRLCVNRQPWGVTDTPIGANPCGYARYNDPAGLDTQVLLTDVWRDGVGEDGGRGQAWRIQSGNAPQLVPMNGNDIYGLARLIPCYNGLVMLRQDNERHYFQAAAIVASQIQLNCEPAWNSGDQVFGDQVFFWFDDSVRSALTAGANPPAPNSLCYVKNVAGNKVELYSDSGLTQKYFFTAAIGRFYLERQAIEPGYYGNGAPPLLAQPNAVGATVWDGGFKQVPVNLQVSNTVSATGVWTVLNHRLVPGDKITLSNMPAGHTPAVGDYYVWPLNDHQLQLFDTQLDALAAATGSQTGLEAISNAGEDLPTMVKKGASGLPMPPGREGCYTEDGRLVIVSNANDINLSDPLDPLHFTPYQSSLTANLGEADAVVFVAEIASSDALVIGKQNSIMALYNLAEGPTQWALRSVTREYGCVAPSARQWGNSLIFMSRRGLDRVIYTAFGIIVGTEKPVSFDLQKYVNQVDWRQAAQSVVETWNNRLFWAFPKTGQAGAPVNNLVATLNFLNSEPQREQFGWEGVWQGEALQVYGFARHLVYGEERLCFADCSGNINWLGDGWLDLGLTPIADSLTTRMYGGAADKQRKNWLKGLIVWDTNNPTLSVTAANPGYNERWPLLTALCYDRTQYLDGSGNVYNPVTQQPPFGTPGREDYSLAGPGELIGGVPDVHQNIAETIRMRVQDWGVQMIIANQTGSCRLVSVAVEGVRGPRAGTRST